MSHHLFTITPLRTDFPNPPITYPKFPLHQLPDPPDHFIFLGETPAQVSRHRRFRKIQVEAMLEYHSWGIDLGLYTIRITTEKLLRALVKLIYYMAENHRPKNWLEVADFTRDAGPRLLNISIDNPVCPMPISRKHPIPPAPGGQTQPGFVRPVVAAPAMSDSYVERMLMSISDDPTQNATAHLANISGRAGTGLGTTNHRYRKDKNTGTGTEKVTGPNPIYVPPGDGSGAGSDSGSGSDTGYVTGTGTVTGTASGSPPGSTSGSGSSPGSGDDVEFINVDDSDDSQTQPARRKRTKSKSKPKPKPTTSNPTSVNPTTQPMTTLAGNIILPPGVQQQQQQQATNHAPQHTANITHNPTYKAQSVIEAIERAVMQFAYDDLKRHPSASTRTPRPNLVATTEADLFKTIIGSFSAVSEVRLSPDDNNNDVFVMDPNGNNYRYYGRGPAWSNYSCAVDCVIVAGMLLDAGSTMIDRKAGWQDRLTPMERAFIEATDVNWDVCSPNLSVTLRDSLWQLLALAASADIELGRVNPPLVVWGEATRSFAQFHYSYGEGLCDCECQRHARTAQDHDNVSLVRPSFQDGDDQGVTMQAILSRYFAMFHHSNCAFCGKKGMVTHARSFGSLPLRMVVALNERVSVRNHTQDITFEYNLHDKESTRPLTARYRWLGGIYFNGDHHRLFWTDVGRGEAGAGEIRVYDPVVGGLIVGGISPFHPEDRVPSSWWRNRHVPLLFYERIMEPEPGVLNLAMHSITDMMGAQQRGAAILQHHIPWARSDTLVGQPSQPLWDPFLPTEGNRFHAAPAAYQPGTSDGQANTGSSGSGTDNTDTQGQQQQQIVRRSPRFSPSQTQIPQFPHLPGFSPNSQLPQISGFSPNQLSQMPSLSPSQMQQLLQQLSQSPPQLPSMGGTQFDSGNQQYSSRMSVSGTIHSAAPTPVSTLNAGLPSFNFQSPMLPAFTETNNDTNENANAQASQLSPDPNAMQISTPSQDFSWIRPPSSSPELPSLPSPNTLWQTATSNQAPQSTQPESYHLPVKRVVEMDSDEDEDSQPPKKKRAPKKRTPKKSRK